MSDPNTTWLKTSIFSYSSVGRKLDQPGEAVSELQGGGLTHVSWHLSPGGPADGVRHVGHSILCLLVPYSPWRPQAAPSCHVPLQHGHQILTWQLGALRTAKADGHCQATASSCF